MVEDVQGEVVWRVGNHLSPEFRDLLIVSLMCRILPDRSKIPLSLMLSMMLELLNQLLQLETGLMYLSMY